MVRKLALALALCLSTLARSGCGLLSMGRTTCACPDGAGCECAGTDDCTCKA